MLRFDCRGFGESSGPLDDGFRHVDDLRALLDQLGIGRATLVGLSMGGQIAMETALLHPERVERLVLVDPFLADFDFSPDWHGMWRELAYQAHEQGIEAAKATWCEAMLFSLEVRHPEAAARLRSMMSGWSGWHLAHPQHFPYVRLSPRLSEIRAPTLVLVGELDLPDFQAIAKQIEHSLPRVQRVVVPGVGHQPNLEDPARFHALVDSFLAH
jgi:pimeloyl-ACP methyl ester carboxylesterase